MFVTDRKQISALGLQIWGQHGQNPVSTGGKKDRERKGEERERANRVMVSVGLREKEDTKGQWVWASLCNDEHVLKLHPQYIALDTLTVTEQHPPSKYMS